MYVYALFYLPRNVIYLIFDLSERPDVATPPVGEGGVDVERGSYLGRFVNDKTGASIIYSVSSSR